MQGLHIMQTVRQLNEDHTYVFGHRHQHFTQVFGLRFPAGNIFAGPGDLSQTGHSIYQLGHFGAKPGFNIYNRHGAVFYYIMQQGGDDRTGIQLQLRKSQSYLQWMFNIRLSGKPCLAFM